MCQLNGSPGPVSLHNVAKNDTFREGRANGLRFNASKGNQVCVIKIIIVANKHTISNCLSFNLVILYYENVFL